MNDKTSKLYRLLKIINLLHSGMAFSVTELAENLEVSVRTVFRDLNLLSLAHIPVYFDKERNG